MAAIDALTATFLITAALAALFVVLGAAAWVDDRIRARGIRGGR